MANSISKNYITRGSIVLVDNPHKLKENVHDHILRGNHYAIVASNNIGNAHSQSIIVAFITSKLKRLDIATNVLITDYPGLHLRKHVIKTSQIATVDKQNIIKYVGKLNDDDLERFDTALKSSLALSM